MSGLADVEREEGKAMAARLAKKYARQAGRRAHWTELYGIAEYGLHLAEQKFDRDITPGFAGFAALYVRAQIIDWLRASWIFQNPRAHVHPARRAISLSECPATGALVREDRGLRALEVREQIEALGYTVDSRPPRQPRNNVARQGRPRKVRV